MGVLVLALYLQSETVENLYNQPLLLWLCVPLMLFWVSWILFAHRGDIHDDPVVFAVTDKASLFCAFSISGISVLNEWDRFLQ